MPFTAKVRGPSNWCWVYTLVITGTSSCGIQKFKKEMSDLFKMSDLGLLHYYVGIEVKQQAKGIFLSQGAYAKRVPEKAGMAECNPCQVPMESLLKLSKESAGSPVDATMYRSMAGSLKYLVNTQPNLAFSVGNC
ncbi:uncharacterized mitochondrial protein AtMg00810-like [Phragmites australis]|uniref:uncharacterized mitochondrial protein AtMg00810-like n=1 Tax=Phragmites australis TaxID=29695 RepID=UPI002D7A126E|nr:uncharacterized mitochondrial protein AtMg00810-like [Phragmites australis]